jgi:2-oxoglutarate dehydrogenase E2 component (dihydrolipoamide succinyltransferase)
MAVELRIPAVGESITEVQLGEWRKQPGERVERDTGIIVIETDKATVELPAPVSGTITKLLKKSGDTAAVGEVIGYMEEGEVAAGAGAAAGRSAGAEPAPAAQAPAASTRTAPAASVHVMPAARRAMAEAGLTPDQVKPTGPAGRILKEDVQRAALPARPAVAPAEPTRAPAVMGARDEEVVPMTLIRRRIAERLVEAQQTAALLTTFNEVDMTAVMELRKAHQEAFQKRYGIKLGFMSFFVKAAVDALKQIPAVNAEIRGDSIVYKNYYDIGIAVSTPKGLVVPVLRHAERMSFAEIEQAIGDFAKRATAGKLRPEELAGGTFTISNGGVYGSLLSTPIVNPPQSGVLGMHTIDQRPVAREGQVVIRPMMYVALTYDHRIVDGREAVSFLRRVKEAIEEPSRMLVEV